jgi:diaminohydroxyphosphoribosylaminopyrimidine deaminase/5-amino-6-(5-phosphoribosylamino)uracil reductase
LLRVILDSHLRLPLSSRIVAGAANDLLVFCSYVDPKKKRELEARGVQVEQISSDSSQRLDIRKVLRHLGEIQITSLIIEGGASVNAAALAAGIVDKVFLYYAPKISGGDALPFASAMKLDPQNENLQLANVRLHRFGEDIAIEGYVRDPYQE